ncbi:MAG: hypothetical protein K0R14_2109 [Burkholderiales bacterium]|jgi:hypothetical protein|nr:hypothetical protein [Burkholderiales bacterium]
MKNLKSILLLIFYGICLNNFVEARKAFCYKDKTKQYTCCERSTTWWFGKDSYAKWVSDNKCPDGRAVEDVFDQASWKEVDVCDLNASMYKSDMANIIQGCGSPDGVVIDDKIEHVCMFPEGKTGDSYSYKFLAWSNIKDSNSIYTSEKIMTNLDNTANLEQGSSILGGEGTLDEKGERYTWKSGDGTNYQVSRQAYTSSKRWEIDKNGMPITYEAKCGLFSDIIKAGGNQNNWNSKAVFDNLTNYNNY